MSSEKDKLEYVLHKVNYALNPHKRGVCIYMNDPVNNTCDPGLSISYTDLINGYIKSLSVEEQNQWYEKLQGKYIELVPYFKNDDDCEEADRKPLKYCGKKYAEAYYCRCGRCDGICGPNNGCQCPDCFKSD